MPENIFANEKEYSVKKLLEVKVKPLSDENFAFTKNFK